MSNATHTNKLFTDARNIISGFQGVTVEDLPLYWGMSGDHKWALVISAPLEGYDRRQFSNHPVLQALRSYSYTHRDERGRRLKVHAEGQVKRYEKIVVHMTY